MLLDEWGNPLDDTADEAPGPEPWHDEDELYLWESGEGSRWIYCDRCGASWCATTLSQAHKGDESCWDRAVDRAVAWEEDRWERAADRW